jgi:hypothetical protein
MAKFTAQLAILLAALAAASAAGSSDRSTMERRETGEIPNHEKATACFARHVRRLDAAGSFAVLRAGDAGIAPGGG